MSDGAAPKLSFHVPAAAHTSSYCNKSDVYQPEIFLVSVYYSAHPHLIPTVYSSIFKLKFNIYFREVLKLLSKSNY
jgi:hypothetical protein